MEIWKDVKGYEGLYQVSSEGRIRKLRFINNIVNKEKVFYIKPQKQNSGYFKVVLYKDGKYENRLLHRLIAEAFLNNEKHFLEVNHKDGNKENNTAENLEWCDRKHNMQEAVRLKLWVSPNKNKFGSNSPKARAVQMIDANTNIVIKEFGSIIEATKYCKGNNGGSIASCCRGNRKVAYGYKWKYMEK